MCRNLFYNNDFQGLTSERVKSRSDLGTTVVSADISSGQALGVEFLITFVLVTCVFAAAADDDNAPNVSGSVPLAIGLSITTCHLLAVILRKYCNSAINFENFACQTKFKLWQETRRKCQATLNKAKNKI